MNGNDVCTCFGPKRRFFFPSVHAGRSFRVRNAQWGQESEDRSYAFGLAERQDARELLKKHTTSLGSSDLKTNWQTGWAGITTTTKIYPIGRTSEFLQFRMAWSSECFRSANYRSHCITLGECQQHNVYNNVKNCHHMRLFKSSECEGS